MALFPETRRSFSEGEFSLAPCLCLLSILSLTSFASFCLRFRSRFFKPRSGGEEDVWGWGRKSSLPGCVSWQPTALHLPAIELHLGLFTTLTTPPRATPARSHSALSLSLSGHPLLNLSEHSNVLPLLLCSLSFFLSVSLGLP